MPSEDKNTARENPRQPNIQLRPVSAPVTGAAIMTNASSTSSSASRNSSTGKESAPEAASASSLLEVVLRSQEASRKIHDAERNGTIIPADYQSQRAMNTATQKNWMKDLSARKRQRQEEQERQESKLAAEKAAERELKRRCEESANTDPKPAPSSIQSRFRASMAAGYAAGQAMEKTRPEAKRQLDVPGSCLLQESANTDPNPAPSSMQSKFRASMAAGYAAGQAMSETRSEAKRQLDVPGSRRDVSARAEPRDDERPRERLSARLEAETTKAVEEEVNALFPWVGHCSRFGLAPTQGMNRLALDWFDGQVEKSERKPYGHMMWTRVHKIESMLIGAGVSLSQRAKQDVKKDVASGVASTLEDERIRTLFQRSRQERLGVATAPDDNRQREETTEVQAKAESKPEPVQQRGPDPKQGAVANPPFLTVETLMADDEIPAGPQRPRTSAASEQRKKDTVETAAPVGGFDPCYQQYRLSCMLLEQENRKRYQQQEAARNADRAKNSGKVGADDRKPGPITFFPAPAFSTDQKAKKETGDSSADVVGGRGCYEGCGYEDGCDCDECLPSSEESSASEDDEECTCGCLDGDEHTRTISTRPSETQPSETQPSKTESHVSPAGSNNIQHEGTQTTYKPQPVMTDPRGYPTGIVNDTSSSLPRFYIHRGNKVQSYKHLRQLSQEYNTEPRTAGSSNARPVRPNTYDVKRDLARVTDTPWITCDVSDTWSEPPQELKKPAPETKPDTDKAYRDLSARLRNWHFSTAASVRAVQADLSRASASADRLEKKMEEQTQAFELDAVDTARYPCRPPTPFSWNVPRAPPPPAELAAAASMTTAGPVTSNMKGEEVQPERVDADFNVEKFFSGEGKAVEEAADAEKMEEASVEKKAEEADLTVQDGHFAHQENEESHADVSDGEVLFDADLVDDEQSDADLLDYETVEYDQIDEDEYDVVGRDFGDVDACDEAMVEVARAALEKLTSLGWFSVSH